MKNVTVRLTEEYVETLDEEANDSDLSRAEYLRELIERGREAEATQQELEATQARVKDLRRQLQQANSRERDVDEIVTYVEEERRLQQRREERRDAPVWTRAKWWLFGRSTDDANA